MNHDQSTGQHCRRVSAISRALLVIVHQRAIGRVALLMFGWLIIGGRPWIHSAMQRWCVAVKHLSGGPASPSP